jgi:hypothetical protein
MDIISSRREEFAAQGHRDRIGCAVAAARFNRGVGNKTTSREKGNREEVGPYSFKKNNGALLLFFHQPVKPSV